MDKAFAMSAHYPAAPARTTCPATAVGGEWPKICHRRTVVRETGSRGWEIYLKEPAVARGRILEPKRTVGAAKNSHFRDVWRYFSWGCCGRPQFSLTPGVEIYTAITFILFGAGSRLRSPPSLLCSTHDRMVERSADPESRGGGLNGYQDAPAGAKKRRG